MDGWGRLPPGKRWVFGAALVAGQQDPSTSQKRFPQVLCCDLAVGLGVGILDGGVISMVRCGFRQ